MGAKQSKRSVDISGKEADGAGEVAAAGAGGEGRVEQLADPDALKAQINGDAHIHEQSDKEKELDNGTPENEKDATTEKEGKEPEGEKDSTTPITNGEGDQKTENGESATNEEGKKPKKEKVKKKWSLRSISFSRKDKPKQEKKQKEEEPTKANGGEPEKVPEETAEPTTPDSPVNEAAEEVKPSTEVKEEKAPETPVTEPITNGSSTPESPKVETPIVEESVVASPEIDRPEPKGEIEPEQLPVNGLSLAEPIQETPEVESKIEEIVENKTETTEVVPVPEIPVIKEVCVTPLIEPSPPPLPANPPPSCVASFAATTMAPELTAASLSNTETAITTELPTLDVKVIQNEPCPDTNTNLTNIQTITNNPIPTIKESVDETIVLSENQNVSPVVDILPEKLKDDVENIQTVIPEIDLPMEESNIVTTEEVSISTNCEEAIISDITIEPVEMDLKDNALKVSEVNIKTEELTNTDDIVVIKVMVDDEVNTDVKEEFIKPIEFEVVPDSNADHEDNEVALKNENIETESNTALDITKHHHNLNNCAREEVKIIEVEENITVKDSNTHHDDVNDSKSNVIELNTPIVTDTEKILETTSNVSDDINDLPPPPPPADDLDDDIAIPDETCENITETLLQTNEINLNIDNDKTKSTDTINENDKETKQEITETLTESVVDDTIETLQNTVCDEQLVTAVKVIEPTPMDDLDTPIVECENATPVEEESLPSPLSEDSETTPAAGTDVHSEIIPPPGAEVCQREEPSPVGLVDALPDTAQDPICEKMVDLLPELPAVPELKTEMLQETSNDVVVAN